MDGVRLLQPGDEVLLFSFLERHLDSSLILLSNAESAGLSDSGEPYQGTYAAHFEAGSISALAVHYSNGNICVQGDIGLEECALETTRLSKRKVKGLIGPLSLVSRARAALGLDDAIASHDGPEILFALDLARLRVPALLSDPEISCRPPTADEVASPLAAWGADYDVETLGSPRAPDLEQKARAVMETWRQAGRNWVLLREGKIVAYTGFNSRARGIVQVGGVWTPPSLRGKGYGRAAVAGSLLAARRAGAHRSTLFTRSENVAAVRAYRALGYEPVGDFSLDLYAV